jgi:hypothetical protein
MPYTCIPYAHRPIAQDTVTAIVGATGNRNTSYRSSIVAQSLSLEYINYISPLLLYTYTIYISLDILQ